MQILDVFSLRVVAGYTRDPQGRLLLEVQPSLAGGGLQHCRHLITAQAGEAETASGPISSASVPVTTEALLRVLLDLEAEQPCAGRGSAGVSGPAAGAAPAAHRAGIQGALTGAATRSCSPSS
ncbi:MAG: hypothetical protein R6U00_13170 [Prochlorococcaceae cyanobacterium]